MAEKTCDRCSKEYDGSIMSMFNEDEICMGCHDKERKHPDYEKARKAENDAVRQGYYNFPGIGKPNDL